MNIHLKKIGIYSKGIYNQSIFWYKEQTRRVKFFVVIALLAVVYLFISLVSGEKLVANDDGDLARRVQVSSVASLSNNERDFPLIGTITSVSEATIRSENGGRLVRVYKKLGDSVFAGAVIAEFDNSGERAALLQAEGAYEQAKAARDIAALNNSQSGSSLVDAKSQALNTIASAYNAMDDAIHVKTDAAYSDPKFQNVTLSISVPDAILGISLENKRRAIESLLRERERKNKSLTANSDLPLELTLVLNELNQIKSYLDDLSTAYSKSIPNASHSQATLDLGKSNVQSARQAISSTLALLVSSRTSLSTSVTASHVSGGGMDGTPKVTGALASADAQVKQALGAYNAAQSRLEKTIIRSPITGTLNSLSINTGDYIGAFTQVAVVSNNGALEVVSYVTEEDAKRITVGSVVKINSTATGAVTRIASAIDPISKKIEVRIGLKDANVKFVNGQSVTILITKNKKESIKNTMTGKIIIPLSSLKLTPRGAFVFTVDASSTLVALPVEEGAILGEQIQIIGGLTGQEDIVVDARGLKEGMHVSVGK